MTFVNVKNRPANGHFNNLMTDFFAPLPSLWKEDFLTSNLRKNIPVNIKETEDAYQLEVVAPGFVKEDFQIGLENNLLTIAVEKKSEEDVKDEKMVRNEYTFSSFKRSFSVDEKIDADGISAQYVNGVLILNLPKKVEVKTIKQITIN
jgi:HSP20 family protein